MDNVEFGLICIGSSFIITGCILAFINHFA